ncbi:disease resistance protein RUN1 isoform X2 [Jatropha curcas]|uniref:disease resistance protein RUN1 isoform X2 n=1 Tax=Jatropha curcas TaxID=180498 RepID=UPI0009D66957|nr:disease resistance protein RUN1 isoform X2 [Jatropha curcas]
MASMSARVVSPSSLLPYSSTSDWKYPVFLSFTNTEQNQTNFVTSLCRELSLKGISSIKDEGRSLEKEQTCEAFEESRFLIVVLSEKYVSSVRCLDLLAKVMDFCGRMGKFVIPIFYNVDPCDLRNQTGRVAEAFIKHEENFREDVEKVKGWKDALTKVASICGWDISQWEEAILIDKIVRDISDKIVYKSSSDTSDLVGMGSHIKEMEKKLCLDSNAVLMVGIWGMGGIGKTTIAKIIYGMLSTHFEVHCFLANVKKNFEKYGAAALLQQLFSTVLMDEINLNGRTFNASFNFIKRRLRLKKVLLVLDDVDDWKQLESLAKEPNWFGQGSRIIITTRDKHLLDAHGVQSIYEVHYLKTDQALQLLSQYAFKQNNPKLEYLELSKQFTSYAKGLPLALRVLGSFLNDKSVLEWQSVQHKLAMIPDLKIHDVLRVSFDGLDDDTQKDVFLDIACFFNGKKKEFVSEILEACGFFPDIAFAVLKDRALITISDNELSMHELLQEMGQEIVREESREEPGKRSRLWITDDVYQVLTKNMGTEIVEGMFLDTSKIREMHLNSEAFVKMYNLRLLKFYNAGSKSMSVVHLPDQGLHSFSNKLRLFHWEGYPSKSLPSSFHAENLVELYLVGSNVEQLWTGVQCLVNLKRIDLSYSKYLTTIPDLSKAQNLERLELGTCRNLVQVSPSVQYLNKLICLDLSNCKRLHCLWDVINLKSLKVLVLTSCSNLTKSPELSGDIRFLGLSDTAIEELPQSIGSLCSLASLYLRNCTRLKKLPSSITSLTSLTEFYLSGCLNISKFPEIPENVQCLDLSGTAIEEVPSSICSLSRLLALDLSNCKKLRTFSSSICKLECLRRLHLSGCSELENFHNLKSLPCLLLLDLSNCYLSEFPRNLSDLSSLEDLDLSKNNFEKVPTSIKHLSKLKLLNVSHCQKLKYFLEIPPHLNVLKACNCTSLETVPCMKSPLDRTVASWDFANCFKLSQKETNKIVEDAQRSFLCMAAASNQVNGNKEVKFQNGSAIKILDLH